MDRPCIVVGEKVHVITRRLFPEDLRRHFVGECKAVSDTLIRIEGYAFVFDASRNEFQKRASRRTRILSLADAGIICNVLPPEVDVDAIRYETIDGRLMVTDGESYRLDINEFNAKN